MKTFLFSIALSFCLVGNSFAEQCRFIIVTPEKTGTHLLTKVVERLTGKMTKNCWAHELSEQELLEKINLTEENNQFLQIHALPTKTIIDTLKKQKYKVLFLIRDPRDVVVSLFHYIEKGWSYGPYRNNSPYGKLSSEEKLFELISGKTYGNSIPHSIIGRRMPWMEQNSNFVCTIHFENLVGEEGGGSYFLQLNELALIAEHLEIDRNAQQLEAVAVNLFGKPGEQTFRKGTIGAWKEQFSTRHKKKFKHVFGKELIQLRYEEDLLW